jgi:hypothetical protein
LVGKIEGFKIEIQPKGFAGIKIPKKLDLWAGGAKN